MECAETQTDHTEHVRSKRRPRTQTHQSQTARCAKQGHFLWFYFIIVLVRCVWRSRDLRWILHSNGLVPQPSPSCRPKICQRRRSTTLNRISRPYKPLASSRRQDRMTGQARIRDFFQGGWDVVTQMQYNFT